MDRQNMFDALEFQNDGVRSYDIDAVSAIERHSLVRDRERHLSSKSDSSEVQFVAEAFLEGRFHKAGTEFTMYFDRRTNNRFGEFLMK